MEKGDSPQSTPTFPELCCHSVEDMRLMNERELIRFQVTPEDMALQGKGHDPILERALHPFSHLPADDAGMEEGV